MRLEGKVALVTGGSRGIGRGICFSFAAEGASVAVNYIHSREAADEAVAEIKAQGRNAVSVQTDVGNYESVERMVESVNDQLGKIDILVNNAGFVRPKAFLNTTREDWHDMIDTHLHGTFNCCKIVLPQMVERRSGRIINISSGVAVSGFFGYSSYCAAKGGIVSLSKTLTKEFASKGIYINVVAPGFIPTELQDSITPEIRAGLLQNIPMKRFGEVDEVSDIVTYLAHSGNYINGQVIYVDGGLI